MTTRFALQIAAAAAMAHLAAGCAKESASATPQAAPTAAVDADAERRRKAAADEEARRAALAAKEAQMQQDISFDFAPIHFAYDSTDLDSDAKTTLDRAAKFLDTKKQVHVTIAGHADERGTTEYNLALGENRAKVVKKYLGALGVDDQRVGTITFGELQPVDSSHTESAFAKNRRAELKANN